MGNTKKVNVGRFGVVRKWVVDSKEREDELLDIRFLNYVENLFQYFNNRNFIYSHTYLVKEKNFIYINVYLYDSIYESKPLDNYDLYSIFYNSLASYESYLGRKKGKYMLGLPGYNLYQSLRLSGFNKLLYTSGFGYYKRESCVNFYVLNGLVFTAQVLVNYIKIKMNQGESLKFILKRLKQYCARLVKYGFYEGYYIKCKGRFFKTARSSSLQVSGGKIKFSKDDHNIEFSNGESILKYGVVNVSVWVIKKDLKGFFYKLEL